MKPACLVSVLEFVKSEERDEKNIVFDRSYSFFAALDLRAC